ncbi:MAG: replication-associated recombination protein A [Elusimicrobia bacterium]|nr:replication-associated recombination protein A [Elusimicrobiota bacterium]
MSPQRLEDFAGQEHILGEGKLLRRVIEADRLTSVIFFGPPGSGKSGLARLIAAKTRSAVEELNAVTIGVPEVKKVLERAAWRRKSQNQKTLIILDEIHHFNRTQQDALLPSVERGEITLIGLTTENPNVYINSALLSRFTAFEFNPLEAEHLEKIIRRAIKLVNADLAPEALAHWIEMSGGDARRILNALEISVLTTPEDASGKRAITLETAEDSIQKRALRYDRRGDEHYDHASAFIKSMRGSDPDAALYWAAKMLAAGEDPRFVARRLIICASEDVGNADPQALLVAAAALEAAQFVGMPEAKLVLAQAILYVACAPKSNAAAAAAASAFAEVESGPRREVPAHLRDSHLDSKSRGHGAGYRYPHDFPGHFVVQEYMPSPAVFYRPSDQGFEKELQRRLEKWRPQKTP